MSQRLKKAAREVRKERDHAIDTARPLFLNLEQILYIRETETTYIVSFNGGHEVKCRRTHWQRGLQDAHETH
jgi:hypothetical protein